MNLSTTYLGLRLKSPLMPGASPLADDLDAVKRLEDAGAAAIVMHSLFEEQVSGMTWPAIDRMELFAEATTHLKSHEKYALRPEQYLEQVARIKRTVSVPVIGSLNGVTPGGWLNYARLIEQAGADALELNVYAITTDPQETGFVAEMRVIDIVRSVCDSVSIPVAVKLWPFYSSLANFASRLDGIGVRGLILFNRLYQSDIDIEHLEVSSTLRLSDSSELLLRLRWLAILSRHLSASLAITGGVHTAADAIKSIMAGADAVQVVSALLKHGPEHLATLERDMRQWMTENSYSSLDQLRSSMSLSGCPDPRMSERKNNIRLLNSFRMRQGETPNE
jgi:dihydroorotate dehydrogenase (fumarate)